ncbi:MAG: hypothetical protein IKB93_04835 [Clostridia bacterium]|nr:hypothetical protein [Clostridia bacterium]
MNDLMKKYNDFVYKYKDITPSIQQIPITKQNSFQYVGGQILNKKLYAVVNSAETMLRYDIKGGKVNFLGNFPKEDFKWTGGCIYKNVFYAFPRKSGSLLAFDIERETFSQIICPFSYDGEHHYGGVCTKDGIIYQPPRSSNNILKWDIASGICEEIIINDGAKGRYCGSILHPDGYVYFIPEAGFCVLKMDLRTEKIVPIGEPVQGFTFDLKIAKNGNIYGFRSATHIGGIMKIDTKKDTVSILYEDVLFASYGTKAGINGKFYSLPGYTKDVWEFDPETEGLRVVHTINSEQKVHYAGGATDVNGNVYAVPVFAEDVLALKFKEDVEIPLDIYKAFFVDFY